MKLRRAACIAAVLVLAVAACSGDDAERPDRASTEGSGKVESGDGDSSALAEAADGSGTPEQLGTVECWGLNYAGLLDAPDGQFTAVSASPGHSCAIRTGGILECWGTFRPPPEGVALVERAGE